MIKPSKSPCARGVVMAKKKGRQLRLCCDFRYLSAVSKRDALPIPRIDESVSKLCDVKFFTTLDLDSAFWQVPMRKKDRKRLDLHVNWASTNGRGNLTACAKPRRPFKD